jgi:hypothetical protein
LFVKSTRSEAGVPLVAGVADSGFGISVFCRSTLKPSFFFSSFPPQAISSTENNIVKLLKPFFIFNDI